MGVDVEPEKEWKIWSGDKARNFVHAPKPDDDKYSRGVLGVIAGSRQYPGAAILVSRAALHTGVGMLRYSGPRSVASLVLRTAPEVVTQKGQVQAWVIGPGLDSIHLKRSRKKDIAEATSQGVPLLIDAGGLPLLPKTRDLVLITPHFRELARTLTSEGMSVSPDEIHHNPKKWAVIASQLLNVTVLLKGTMTIIASHDQLIELPPSTSWLATAGSGDVLAGIIGALLATNSAKEATKRFPLAEIAATGSLIHARAGERASAGGPISATDLIEAIPGTIGELLR